MKLHFTCSYASSFGENILIRFQSDQTTAGIDFPMVYINEKTWGLELERDELPSLSTIIYDILVRKDNDRVLAEQRKINLENSSSEHIFIFDEPQWMSFPSIAKGLITEFLPNYSSKKHDDKNPDFILSIQLPDMHPDHVPCVTGSIKKLGNWKGKPALFHQKNNEWILKLKMGKEKFPVEFKIGIYDKKLKEIIHWESGDNRVLQSAPQQQESLIWHAVPDIQIALWKGTGINVPLTSLLTEKTWGSGDFTSLKVLGNWCKKSHINMIQLLPLYDTTANFTNADSYPYSPISAFAMHPVFLDVHHLVHLYDVDISEDFIEKIKELNSASEFHINEVLELKLDVLRIIFEEVKTIFKDDFGWFTFFDMNREWLQPYAAFSYLRDTYKTADFHKWETWKVYDETEVEELVSRESIAYEEICFYYFLQYNLHLQLAEAKEYLNKKGIILKGDLPIGIGRSSVDTWMFPQLFNLDKNAGAPPDAFTQLGQNWKFPTYNWKAMEAEDYAWFRRRLQHLEIYFNALRIDHIIGLFRIWSIPVDQVDGRLGIFEPANGYSLQELRDHNIHMSIERLTQPYGEGQDIILLEKNQQFHFRIDMQQTSSFKSLHENEQQLLNNLHYQYFSTRQNDLWNNNGVQTIQALQQCTRMLLCAEDLGMVPAMVESVLDKNKILCLRVERMPVNHEKFFSPAKAPYLSVVTPSTHDMSTLRQWWTEPEAPVQWYYNFELLQEGLAPAELNRETAQLIIQNHLHSPAMFSVFLLQDILAMDDKLKNHNLHKERINDPAFGDFEWSYRMHISLENLLQAKAFTKELKKMIKSSGRK